MPAAPSGGRHHLRCQRLYPVAVARSGDKTGDGIDDAIDSETLVYDDQGRETRGIDGDWQVVQREYDSVDRVIRATDALGHWRDYQYDANGNLINEALTVANARVDSRVAVYDDADRQVQVIDAAGNATRMEIRSGRQRKGRCAAAGHPPAYPLRVQPRPHHSNKPSGYKSQTSPQSHDLSRRILHIKTIGLKLKTSAQLAT